MYRKGTIWRSFSVSLCTMRVFVFLLSHVVMLPCWRTMGAATTEYWRRRCDSELLSRVWLSSTQHTYVSMWPKRNLKGPARRCGERYKRVKLRWVGRERESSPIPMGEAEGPIPDRAKQLETQHNNFSLKGRIHRCFRPHGAQFCACHLATMFGSWIRIILALLLR